MPGEPAEEHASPVRRSPWRVVLLLQALFAAALYAPTLGLGLMSDAWVLVGQARNGFWSAITTVTGWHYIPVASGLNALVWPILRDDAAGWQALTIVLHLAVAHLTYRLGLILLGDVPASLTASLLFLGSAAYYEATLWPVVGHTYALAAVLYMLGLETVIEIARPDTPRSARWRLAGWFLAAVLCYGGMVTLLPLAAIVLLLCRFRGLAGAPPRPWRKPAEWLAVGGALLPCALTLAVPVIARTHVFAREMSEATHVTFDWFRAYGLDRGLAAVFSMRGSGRVPHVLVTLGTELRGGPWLKVMVWGWLILAAFLTLRACLRSRSLAYPLLLVWLLLQLGLAAATLIVFLTSRHTYLAAVPAALLTAAVLRDLGVWLFRRRAQGLLRLAPMVLVGLTLLLGAWVDLQAALDAARYATALSRRVAADMRAAVLDQEAADVTIVDLPSVTFSGGIPAYVFANGQAEMLRVASGRSDLRADLRCTPGRRASRGSVAIGCKPLTAHERGLLAADPKRIVLLFDPRTGGLARVTPSGQQGLVQPRQQ